MVGRSAFGERMKIAFAALALWSVQGGSGDLGSAFFEIEGKGSKRWEWVAPGAGTFYLHAEGEVAPPTIELQLEGKRHGTARRLPGTNVVATHMPLVAGNRITVEITSELVDRLHFNTAFRATSEDCRAATEEAHAALAFAREMQAVGEIEAAREARAAGIQVLLDLPEARFDHAAFQTLLDLADAARRDRRGPADDLPWRRIASYLEDCFPPQDTTLLGIRLRLLEVLYREGKREEGLEVAEIALTTLEEFQPDGKLARSFLEKKGAMLVQLGRYEEARPLLEDLLARHRARPLAISNLEESALVSLGNLAWQSGDLEKARSIFEILSKRLSGPAWASTVGNLAAVLAELGEGARVAELQRDVYDYFARTLPDGHPNRRRSALNLGITLRRSLKKEGLDLLRSVAEGNDDLALSARYHLASALAVDGNLAEAREAYESIISARLREVGPLHPYVADTYLSLLRVLRSQGDEAASEGTLRILLESFEQRLARFMGASRRARSEQAAEVLANIAYLDEVAGDCEAAEELQRRVFVLAEGLRALAVSSPRFPEDDELGPEANRLRGEWREASTAWLEEGLSPEPDPERLLSAQLRMEETEGRYRVALHESGWREDPRVSLTDVAGCLGARSGLVVYRIYGAELVPHVLRSTGELQRLPGVPARAVDEAVQAWLQAIGRPFDGRPTATTADVMGTGRHLRELVLDAALEVLPGATELIVCLDGPLHMIPLDALPSRSGKVHEVVGDDLRVRVVSSLALRLPFREQGDEDALLLVGPVDYGSGSPLVVERSFASIEGARPTVRGIRERFDQAVAGSSTWLSGEAADQSRVRAAAEAASNLFVQTHGFFDRRASGTEVRLAPLAYSGIALSRANSGLGDGLLFAEELATWDLSRCRLAVLSACEGGAGALRVGVNLWSMRAALHTAGVQTSITALWEVSPTWTYRLMGEFYARLWSEGMSADEALWEAKRVLRAERVPPKDWAGWVVGGALTRRP